MLSDMDELLYNNYYLCVLLLVILNQKRRRKSKHVIDWKKQKKILLVEYKGGKCEQCGYNKCIEALEFHHKSPNEKILV